MVESLEEEKKLCLESGTETNMHWVVIHRQVRFYTLDKSYNENLDIKGRFSVSAKDAEETCSSRKLLSSISDLCYSPNI